MKMLIGNSLNQYRKKILTKQLETLPEDIYNLLEKEDNHEINEENLDALLDNIEEILKDRLQNKSKERTALRFSSLGMPDRKLWYRHNTPEDGDKLKGQTLLKFLYGHIIEELVVFLAKESGHTVEDEQREVNVDGVLGHTDGKIDGVVVDVKSASPYGFKKFKENSVVENDPFGYVSQLAGYADEITPGEKAAWVAFDKVSGEISISTLSSSIIKDNKPEPRIEHLKKVLEEPSPPDRCYSAVPDGKSGNMKLDTGCSYCEFRNKCWPDLRTFIYSTGPRFLTNVSKVPNVPEV